MSFSWFALFRALVLEATLVIGCALAMSALAQSGFWRRSIWQACVLALGLLVACESTGVGRALLARLPIAHDIETSEAEEESQPVALTPTYLRSATLWLNEKPTLAAARPATSVRQTWWPGVIWLTGCVLIGTRLGFAMLLFGRFRKQRRLVRDSNLAKRLTNVADRLSVRRGVRVSQSETLISPVAFGIFRPCICVPADFTRRFNPEQQSAMLAHEMAHVAGHDAVWYWLADVVTALLWWHPLVWFARRKLHASSEDAADEASLAVENGPDLLAECLVQLGVRLQRPRNFALLGFFGFRSDLGRRVVRLVQLPRRAWRPFNRVANALIKATALLSFTCVALVCLAWTDPPAADTTLKTAWTTSLARAALIATTQAIEDFKLSDALPNPLALPAAKARSPSKKPILMANAQAAPLQDLANANRESAKEFVQAESSKPNEPPIDRDEARTSAIALKPLESSQAKALFTRVFKVDPVTFIAGVKGIIGIDFDHLNRELPGQRNLYGSPLPGPVIEMKPSPSDAIGRLVNRPGFAGGAGSVTQIKNPNSLNELIQAFFAGAGVGFEKPDSTPPEQRSASEGRKAVFFNDRTGLIFARATLEELDLMDKAIQVLKARPPSEKLEARVFRVNPQALRASLERWAKASPRRVSESDAAAAEGESVVHRLLQYLSTMGVSFPVFTSRTDAAVDGVGELPLWPEETDPHGSAAAREETPRNHLFYKDRLGLIFARATSEDLSKIEKAIQRLDAVPQQVRIEVAFVEIAEGGNKALGLDWLFSTGLTWPESSALPSAPMQDAMRFSPEISGAVAIAARMAILSDPQFRVLRRALEQRPGLDIFTAPPATAMSGQRARIDLTEPKSVLDNTGKKNAVSTGPDLNVIPLVKEDGRSIELAVLVNILEFLGYDDPGPFKSGTETRDLFDPPQPDVNRGPLPRFRLRQSFNNAVVPNGQTLVLTALTAKDFSGLTGQTPNRRNEPPVGRRFRADPTPQSRPSKELLIFITPTVIDSVGE